MWSTCARARWLLLCAIAVLAQDDARADDYRDLFGKGKQYVGLSLGSGVGFSMGFMGDGDGKDVNFFDLRPRYGVGVTNVLGEGHWYRGDIDFMLEGEFLFEFDGGTYQGLALMFRYNFLREGRLIPFVELGSGMGNLDFDLDDQSDGFNLTPQLGIGFHYFVAERVSLNGATRWHHISNGGTKHPNNSINDFTFTVGATYFLE
jgi:opacity protein-like surface antigen